MTPEELIAQLNEPRRAATATLDAAIRRAGPSLTPGVSGKVLTYGRYHYRYASGREGDAPIVSLAITKTGVSVYVNAGDGERYLAERYADRLGEVSVGRSCIRIKDIDAVDLHAFEDLIRRAVEVMPTMPGVTATG